MTINGRRVLITGAGGSLGTALALACAQRGCSLILCDHDGEAVERLCRHIPKGTAIRPAILDITATDAVRTLFEQLIADGQSPELVINNAALSCYGRFQDVPPATWQRLLEVNLQGAMMVTAHAVPTMLARRYGHLVFISSLSGLCASAGLSAYAASKHALHGFAEALYLELRTDGIGVSVICPSTLRSEIATRMEICLAPSTPPELVAAWRRRAEHHRTHGIPCQAVAARCLRTVEQGRFLEVIGWDARLAYLAKRWLGAWYWPILARTTPVQDWR